MRTLLDLIGFSPLRPLIVFGGDETGGGGSDSRSDRAKALDETGGTSAADAYRQYADTMIAGGGGTNLSGIGSSAYEASQALAGRDDDLIVSDDTNPISQVVYDRPSLTDVIPDSQYRNLLQIELRDNDPSAMTSGPTIGGVSGSLDSDLVDFDEISSIMDDISSTSPTMSSPDGPPVDPYRDVRFAVRGPSGSDVQDLFESGQIGRVDVINSLMDSMDVTAGGEGFGDEPPMDIDMETGEIGVGFPLQESIAPSPQESGTAVPDVDLSKIYGQYRKSPNEPEARFIRDLMRFAKDDEGEYVVKPRLGDYLERAGIFVADLMLPEELLGLDISSATPNKVNAALEAYKTGSLAYGPDGRTVIGVNDSDGNLIRLRPDSPIDPFANQDDDGCPPGYERNPVTGVCEPIEEEIGPPRITLPDIGRPDPSPVRPDPPFMPPILPDDGINIGVPRFSRGGSVTGTYDFTGFDTDNPFTLSDVTSIQRYDVGMSDLDQGQLSRYDLNRDGVVDNSDAVAGLNYLNYVNPETGFFDEAKANQEDFYLYSPPTPGMTIRTPKYRLDDSVNRGPKDVIGEPVYTTQPAELISGPSSNAGMNVRASKFAEGGPVTPNIDRFLNSLRG